MSTTLITSRDSKGSQAVRLFEDAYNKAKLNEERAQRLNEHPEFAPRLKKLIDELSRPKPVTQYPPIDEWFELTVDNSTNLMDVVTTADYNADGWKFFGPKFESKTYKVKLVELGYVKNLEEARIKATTLGYRLLEGQAREQLKAVYPKHNGRPILFGGNEWQNPYGDRHVTYLLYLGVGSWFSDFLWSDSHFDDRCLWAVVQQDA